MTNRKLAYTVAIDVGDGQTAEVDQRDAKRVSSQEWSLDAKGPYTKIDSGSADDYQGMGEFILRLPLDSEFVVSYLNGNPLDNRRNNLIAIIPEEHCPKGVRYIPLTGRAGITGKALVSAEDYERVMKHRWHRHPKGYAISGMGGGYSMMMHRFILDLERGDARKTDHINRDKLDNRRENLRIATYAQNLRNRRKFKGSTSKYKGLSWTNKRQKWDVIVRLGLYDKEDEELASRIYQWAIKKLFNDNNRLRFWDEEGIDASGN